MISYDAKNRVFKAIGNLFGFSAEMTVRDLYNKLTGSSSIGNMHTIQKGQKGGGKYFVLRYQTNVMGLAAVMRDVLFVDEPARKHGFKVLVEYDSNGCRLDDVPYDNLWESFFVQMPTTKKALSDKNNTVIVSPIDARGLYDKAFMKSLSGKDEDSFLFYPSGDEGLSYRKKLQDIASKYYVLKDSTRKEFDKEFERVNSFSNGNKIIGVLMREEFSDEHLNSIKDTDELKVLSYHPHVPNTDEVIGLLDSTMKETGAKKILLATLYEETIERFYRVFGRENVYVIDRVRLKTYSDNCLSDLYDKKGSFKDGISGYNRINEKALFERNKKYLLELYLLSRCDVFFSAKCGGGFIVPIMRQREFDRIVYLENKNENCSFV